MHRLSPLALLALLTLLTGCADSLVARAGGEPDYSESDPLAGDDDDMATGDDDDIPGDDDDDDGVGLVNLDPAPGSSDHHYRQPLLIVFDTEASGAEVALADDYGVAVPHTLEWNDARTRVWIHPVSWLEPDSTYSVSIALGSLQQSYLFSTSHVGVLDVEPESLVGSTWGLQLGDARVLAPSDLGAASTFELAGAPLLGLQAVSPSVSLEMGMGVEELDTWSQDGCSTAGAVDTPFELDGSYLSAAPELLTLHAGHTSVTLEAAWVATDVLPDGSGLAELELSGWLHESSLGDLLETPYPCEALAAGSSSACEPCPSTVGSCVWVEVDGVSAVEVQVELESVSPSEVDACPEGPTQWIGCSASGARGTSLLGWLLLLPFVRRRRR